MNEVAQKKSASPSARSNTVSPHSAYAPRNQSDQSEIRNILRSNAIQAQLTVGAPNDSYEVEADRVADRIASDLSTGTVMNRTASGLVGREVVSENQNEEPIQQQTEEREEEPKETEELQKRWIQKQSSADDEEELQAQYIQRQPQEDDEALQAKFIQRQPNKEEDELQAKHIQRQSEDEEETLQAKYIQRQSEGDLEKDEVLQAKPERSKKDVEEGKQLKYIVNIDEPKQEPKEEVQAKAEPGNKEEEEPVQTKEKPGAAPPGPSMPKLLAASKGGGAPLSPAVRADMEAQFSADFSAIRVHTDGNAVAMNKQIHAQAFTQGRDIYFNEGKYEPASSDGRHLLAHELTHTIQQGSVSQHSKAQTPVEMKSEETARPKIRRSWYGDAWDAVSDAASAAVDYVAEQLAAALNYAKGLFTDFARAIPGYRLLSVILGQDPISGDTVERNGINFIEAGLDVIPFGGSFKAKLEETGKLQEAAAWLDGEINSLEGVSLSAILDNLSRFWDSLSITDLGDVTGVLERAADIIRNPIARIVTFCGNVASYFLALIKNYLLGELSDYVASQEQSRAFPLLTVILGKNPITDEEVERNGMNLIRGFMLLSEDGEEQLRQMEESGSLQRAADWIDTQVANLGLAWEGIKNAFSEAWALVTIENLVTDPIGTFIAIVDKFVAPVMIIINFLLEVATMILSFIKDALLSRLSAYARETRGYPLLTVILGKDPFTGNPVERNAENMIHGFMSLMEGGEEQFQEMKESGAIQRMTDRIERAVAKLNFTWEYITGLFLSLWNSLSLRDLAAPIEAFMRIVGTLADPVMRLIAFVVEVVKIAIEIALKLMNFPIELVTNIMNKAVQAFNDIKRDPIGFLKNLLRAVKTGFVQFFDRIGTHLLNGVTGWLFKELGDAGISPPADLSFRSILGLVLDVLGISMDRIFERLALKIGQERVDRIRAMGERLAGAWAFISDVRTRGPIAIWEYVKEKLSNLWTMVLDAVSNWIVTQIISQVTAKLLSMLDPTGIMAVVNGFIAFFKAVQSFIAYLREMLEIVNSFVEGVAEIAAGSVSSAANYLEGALASAMPVAIGFLANQVGLGGLGRRIGEMIGRVREKVTEGIDWLIDKAMRAGSSIMNMLRGGGGGEQESGGGDQQERAVGAESNGEAEAASSPNLAGMSVDAVLAMPPSAEPRDAGQKQQDVNDASALVTKIINRSRKTDEVEHYFPQIKRRFGLRSIIYEGLGTPEAGVEISVNPRAKIVDNKLTWDGVAPGAAQTMEVTFGGTSSKWNWGTSMEAKRIGPNHPQGGPPSASALSSIMDNLVTGQDGDANDKYIKGHLLNDNIGGPGEAANLFPITARANSQHVNEVEKKVKGWVNDDRYWVHYKVDVEGIKEHVDVNKSPSENYVDADFVCEAHPLKADGKHAAGGFKKTIKSVHNSNVAPEPGTVVAGSGAAAADTTFVGTPELSTTKSGAKIRIRVSTASESELKLLDGIGATRAKTIFQNQPYQSHAEIANLSGIGESVWSTARATDGYWVTL